MVNRAGDYAGSCIALTSILYEGNITAQTSIQVAGGTLGETAVTFAAAISDGDYVGLFNDTANTYDACKGIPVVTTVSATTGIIGKVVSQPKWQKIPTSSQTTWATMLSNEYYRTAVVKFYFIGAEEALSDGNSTAIDVGAPLKWSAAGDGWVDNDTTHNGVFSLHYNASANTSILIGITGAGGLASADETGLQTDT